MMPVLRPDYGHAWVEDQARKDADDRMAIMFELVRRDGLTVTGEIRIESPPEALQLVALGPADPSDGVVAVWRQKTTAGLYRSQVSDSRRCWDTGRRGQGRSALA